MAAASAAFWAARWAAIIRPPSTTMPVIPSRAAVTRTACTIIVARRPLERPGKCRRMGNTSMSDVGRGLRLQCEAAIKNQREHGLVRGGNRHPDPRFDKVVAIRPFALDGRLA